MEASIPGRAVALLGDGRRRAFRIQHFYDSPGRLDRFRLQRGPRLGDFEWMAVPTLILLSLVFAPFYFKSKISTLPEFLERRYGPASRSFLAFMAIMAALFIHIGMSLYAGAAVFQQFFGINVVASVIIISVITAIYTVLGGLKAVVVLDDPDVYSACRRLHNYGTCSQGFTKPWNSYNRAV